MEGLSKNQLKKLAKQKARDERKQSHHNESQSVETTPEMDYSNRVKIAEIYRQKYATMYRPPLKLTHHTYLSLNEEYFKHMESHEKGYHLDDEVIIMGRVSSSRTAGKLGFLTIYFGPEKIVDGDNILWFLRPELQIIIRPQTLQLATIKQIGTTELMSPKLKIEKEYFDTEDERMEATVAYIKQFTKTRARTFDQYYIVGYPGLSNTGERTIYAKHIFPVSINNFMGNAIHGADEHGVHSFSNPDVGYRNPYIRWLYDIRNIHIQIIREQYKKNLQKYLEDDIQLMQIDIPHLVAVSSGANAKPFETRQHDNDMDLQLRIAPELELKMCIIGGLSTHGCYHIGSQFRNEGQDATHNPEFSSCEFYIRNMDFAGLMMQSEHLISTTIRKTLSNIQSVTQKEFLENILKIPSTNSIFHKEDETGFNINWDIGFVNIKFLDGINQNLQSGYKLPDPLTFETVDAREEVIRIAYEHDVKYKDNDTISKILDNLFDELVLPLTYRDDLPNSYFKERDEAGNLMIKPVTVYGHPKIMSPLAMEVYETEGVPTGIVYRFESFVAGMEICNAYQELSDPVVQMQNFESQRNFQNKGDDEAMTQNDSFIKGLEYGMCPTAGWGMGLERIYMILSDRWSIRDVLPFPLMKPISKSIK